jgi:hypothetical protein
MTDALPFPSSNDEAGAAIPPRPAEAPPAESEAAAVPAAPYVGPRAFRPGETLYGRNREAAELMDVLVAERIVLCHSPSGAGKTSLIQAELLPRLEKAGFAVYGPARVGSALGEGTPAGANRYVLSALLGMEKERDERLRAKIGKGEAPASAQTEPIPVARLAGMTFAEYLELRSADDEGRDAVLVFDQFEEILTLDSNDVEAKAEFFRQVGAGLRPRHRWALFAMREEYVAALDPYLHLVPTGLACRYPLTLLDASGARAAIAMPARDRGRPFTDEALDKLVDNLLRAPQPGSPEGVRGRWVEPVQLQVVCTRLWQKLPPDTTEIGTEQVGGVDDVDTALADYYAETVARVAAETRVKERDVRRWFDRALISGGVRTQVARFGENAYGLNEDAVRALVDAYLVRREERRASLWYELAHDRLMAPVKSDNARWFAETASAAQRQAAIWIGTRRAATALLRGRDIEAAERWVKENPDEQTDDVKELIAASRAFRRRHRRNKAIATVGGAVLLGVAAWGLATTVREGTEQRAAVDLDSATQTAANKAVHDVLKVQGRAVQEGVTVWYFAKAADPGVVPPLRAAGFTVDEKRAQNQVPTNWVLYGDSVDASTLRLLASALIGARVPLKGICPLRNQSDRRQVVQVLGMSDKDEDPPVTVEQVAGMTDSRRDVNCTAPPVVVLQYYGGDPERERVGELRTALMRAGYRVPGAENRNERITVVRYFDPDEKELADNLAATAARLLGRADPIRVQLFPADVPARRLELWVDLTDTRPAAAAPR